MKDTDEKNRIAFFGFFLGINQLSPKIIYNKAVLYFYYIVIYGGGIRTIERFLCVFTVRMLLSLMVFG